MTYTIVGVAPAGLDYPTGAEYWIPPWPDATGGNGGLSVIAVARLAPGATASAAEAEVFRIVNATAPELHLTGASATPLVAVMLGNIRRALGASYAQLVRQLLAESVMLALGGGLLGLHCAIALLRTLLALAPARLPRIDKNHIDTAAVLTALGVTGLAVSLFGVVPALLAARSAMASTLRLDARSGKEARSGKDSRW